MTVLTVCVYMYLPHVLFVFCVSEVISSYQSLRVGSQVFSRRMAFLCVILHSMWTGKSMRLLCILPFGMLCLTATSMVFDCGDDG